MRKARRALFAFTAFLIVLSLAAPGREEEDTLPPLPPVEGHQGRVLWGGADRNTWRLLSKHWPDEHFQSVVNQVLSAGADTVYVAANTIGKEGAVVSVYERERKLSGRVDESAVRLFHQRLEYLRRKGLGVVMFVYMDDRRTMRRPLKEHSSHMTFLVREFDRYVSCWVLANEIDSTLKYREAGRLFDLLDSLTEKPIGSHQEAGGFEYSRHRAVDFHFHQYGWGLSRAEIRSETRRVMGELGKPVVAAEFNRLSASRKAARQRSAALAAGAVAVGN